MTKTVSIKRGRPARELGPSFFVSVLKEIKAEPKTVRQITIEGISDYYMEKLRQRGYAEAAMIKIKEGRGRSEKHFKMTEKGRKYLSSTVAREARKA